MYTQEITPPALQKVTDRRNELLAAWTLAEQAKKLTEIAFLFAGAGALLAGLAAGLSLWWFGRIA